MAAKVDSTSSLYMWQIQFACPHWGHHSHPKGLPLCKDPGEPNIGRCHTILRIFSRRYCKESDPEVMLGKKTKKGSQLVIDVTCCFTSSISCSIPMLFLLTSNYQSFQIHVFKTLLCTSTCLFLRCNLIIYLCVCISVGIYAHIYGYLQMTEEGNRCPGTEVISSCESLDMNAENWTSIVWKRTK